MTLRWDLEKLCGHIQTRGESAGVSDGDIAAAKRLLRRLHAIAVSRKAPIPPPQVEVIGYQDGDGVEISWFYVHGCRVWTFSTEEDGSVLLVMINGSTGSCVIDPDDKMIAQTLLDLAAAAAEPLGGTEE